MRGTNSTRPGITFASTKETSKGVVNLDEVVDPKVIEWVTGFCGAELFGGAMETDVPDLPQALARFAEFAPVLVDPRAIWRHHGISYSIEGLLEAWDEVEAVAEACSPPDRRDVA